MAFFSRRIIARCLSENRTVASAEKIRDWVRRLNTISDDYVAVEWELVLLSAFSKCGNVQYEPATLRAPIDLHYEAYDGRLRFAADIVAISDREMNRRNPVDRFQEELCKRITKAKIGNHRFCFAIDEERPTAMRGSGAKRQLLLPLGGQLATQVFNSDFDRFMERVRAEPHVPQSLVVRNGSPPISVSIQYSPGPGSLICGRYGSYAATTVRDNNPLFNALKRKADQLRRSGYQGLRGIIVCDDGAQILHESSHLGTYTIREVVRDFFRQNTSIAFVITIAVRWKNNNPTERRRFEYKPQLFTRDAAAELERDLGGALRDAIACLPQPSQTPENATHTLRWNRSTKITRPYYGGWEVKGDRIKISARELLDLLAGKLDQKRFAQHHATGRGNIFNVFRDQGKMIRKISLERQDDEDDDWIVLEFTSDDPAAAEFKMPSAEEPHD
jgi:hypothetical protein